MTMIRPPHGGDLRKGRVSEPGRAYLLTFVTRSREPLFLDFSRGRCLVQELRAVDAQGLSKTLAFVVMPDHCHWLAIPCTVSLSDLVGRVKARSAKGIARAGGVWQRGFHDHALRREEDLRATARYIIANPLRAGLVSNIGDYPLWDAVWM